MCERVWRIAHVYAKKQGLAGGLRLQAARMMHTCQACQKLKCRASYCTTRQKSQANQAICSRLELVTQSSREVKSLEHPVWENLTFHIPSHPTIYIPTRMMHTCQACQKLKHHTNYCTTGQKSQAGQAICSRLELATQPSRKVKSSEHPIWENITFHIPSHPTIYVPLYPQFRESF